MLDMLFLLCVLHLLLSVYSLLMQHVAFVVCPQSADVTSAGRMLLMASLPVVLRPLLMLYYLLMLYLLLMLYFRR